MTREEALKRVKIELGCPDDECPACEKAADLILAVERETAQQCRGMAVWDGNVGTGRRILAKYGLCLNCYGTGETCPAGPSDAPMNTCSKCGGSGAAELLGERR